MSDEIVEGVDDDVEFLIRINYKSGLQETGWFTKFKVEHTNGNLTSLSYQESDGMFNFIFIGFNDIESIVQLEYRKKSVDK